ncbi:AMP-binding protein [Sphingomonas sp.]|uniref:AMP-binding protein n=1 Tax=Sphingomonas sp. TaxID=28214 RepID=UPI002DB986D8|nr:AMP-binding protein [Sphingomonas sp.]HEU4969547.1 AMP-binding protein [Sphingomonas sp.]
MTAPRSLPELLARRAAEHPDRIAIRCEEEAVTYRELEERSGRIANGLVALGVSAGDPVCVLLETSSDYVATWLAINRIGAVEVPINAGFRGAALAHALALTGARLLILDAVFLDAVAEVLADAPNVRHAVLRGDPAGGSALPLPTSGFDAFLDEGAEAPAIIPVDPYDTAMLLFTSGSTGPSKGCCIPHSYIIGQPAIFCRELGIGPDDTLYAPFPLFHADGAIFTAAAAITAGGCAALAARFSVSRFWDDCRRHGATVIDYMGATLTLLFRAPPTPRDRDHKVRLAWGVPAPVFADAFEERFGLELVEVYGLSDAGIVLYNPPGEPRRKGSCGRAVAPFTVEVHDPEGRPMPNGEIGEIVIRSSEPGLITAGYYGDEAATAGAFRNGWLRTGDLARRDADGYFHFVGRLKDIIRRRGENISAFDIEQVLGSHPDILEVAAYGVPSELTEDDVMVTAVPRPGARVDHEAVRNWAARQLARHMVPRYVRLAEAIPRTPTEKVAKHVLAAEGVTGDTVDFEPSEVRMRGAG